MSYKPKKVNGKNNKKKNQKDSNKFHLGWNTGTYLLIGLGIVLAVLILLGICTGVSYSNTYKNNTQHPYTDEGDSTDFESYKDAVFVEAKDFKDLTISFYASSFDSHDAHKAKFNVEILVNDNTGGQIDLINNKFEKASSGSYGLYARVNLSNNWIGYSQYSDLTGFYKTYLQEETKQSKTIDVNLAETTFPAKTTTCWPVPVEVRYPEAYLFVCYYLQGQSTPKQYVIHYAPSDYIVTEASEGKTITSPAI